MAASTPARGEPGDEEPVATTRRHPRTSGEQTHSPATSWTRHAAVVDRLVEEDLRRFAREGYLVVSDVVPDVPGGPHIDGHRPGPDAPASFTLLAAVFLTDQRASQSGNLWVWPGSHLDHQRLFLDRGTDALKATGGHATLLHPPVQLSAPVEVRGGRGDLLLAHFLLGHNKGGNTGPQARRTIYYRLAVHGHAERWASTFLDPWTEYLPVRRALAA